MIKKVDATSGSLVKLIFIYTVPLIVSSILSKKLAAGCDVVVLETGMGGRLDSTNVIKAPLFSVITGIAMDHTAFLGDTVEKIVFATVSSYRNQGGSARCHFCTG